MPLSMDLQAFASYPCKSFAHYGIQRTEDIHQGGGFKGLMVLLLPPEFVTDHVILTA